MPKVTLNYCSIADVLPIDTKKGNEKNNRQVIIHINEEDLFNMFDTLNPQIIIKYLDIRCIPHREPANITVKVRPDANGLKLRHNLKRIAAELRNVREGGKK